MKRRSSEGREDGKRPRQDDENRTKRRQEETAPQRRPDFTSRQWRAGEIRILNADKVSIIHRQEWMDIEYKIIVAFADITEEIRKKTGKPPKNYGTRHLFYDKDLKCGVVEVKDVDRLKLIRDLLANSIRNTPRLQLLTRFDRLTPVVTTFAPRVFNGFTTESFVKNLTDFHECLQTQPFKLLSVVPAANGRTFRFETTQFIVDYIVKRNHRLQHLHDKIHFDKRIERLILPVGLTMMEEQGNAKTSASGKAPNNVREVNETSTKDQGTNDGSVPNSEDEKEEGELSQDEDMEKENADGNLQVKQSSKTSKEGLPLGEIAVNQPWTMNGLPQMVDLHGFILQQKAFGLQVTDPSSYKQARLTNRSFQYRPQFGSRQAIPIERRRNTIGSAVEISYMPLNPIWGIPQMESTQVTTNSSHHFPTNQQSPLFQEPQTEASLSGIFQLNSSQEPQIVTPLGGPFQLDLNQVTSDSPSQNPASQQSFFQGPQTEASLSGTFQLEMDEDSWRQFNSLPIEANVLAPKRVRQLTCYTLFRNSHRKTSWGKPSTLQSGHSCKEFNWHTGCHNSMLQASNFVLQSYVISSVKFVSKF
jgi:hypothetical protein